jgi:hypothetical protein
LFRRIDETVATNPYAVRRARELRDEVATAVVGDDDLRELRREIGGLGDDPDTGFGAARAGHSAGDHGRSRLTDLGREITDGASG